MEILKITLPDKTELYTHELDDEHTRRIIRHWTDKHSDEYELVPIHVDLIRNEEGAVYDSVAWMEPGTGKKSPKCNFELLDMPEQQYRELKPYPPHPTCRLGA